MAASPVIRFLQHVWDNEGKAMGGRSWNRLNQSMGMALNIAVSSGFKFAVTDFSLIESKFSFSHWAGTPYGERYYSMACAVDRAYGENLSAAKSFEAWQKRAPFIYKDKECMSGRRLAIGSEVRLIAFKKGEPVGFGDLARVTSFGKEGNTFIATVTTFVGSRSKVKSRMKVTRLMLEKHNAAIVGALGPKFKKGDVVTIVDTNNFREGAEAKVIGVLARSVRITYKVNDTIEKLTVSPDQIRKKELQAVKFDTTAKDSRLVNKILVRAEKMAAENSIDFDAKELSMDIIACHCNGTPLNLEKLLGADDATFGHDVWGIRKFIDRETGKVPGAKFSPRCHA